MSHLENTRRSANGGFMLAQRRRRWFNIKPELAECLMIAGSMSDNKINRLNTIQK